MVLTVAIPTKTQEHRNADQTGLRGTILDIIRNHANNSERSLQKRIGPSQVGTPCHRRLAFEMSGIEETRDLNDPLASILGTAYHAWLAECFTKANPAFPAPPIWLLENRVDVGFGLRGSSDVFHVPTGTVLDWKLLGNTTFDKYTKVTPDSPTGSPSEEYRVQAHSYGLGFARAGFTVNRVAIVMFGRSKYLRDLHIWSEPWQPDIALRALNRMVLLQEYLGRGLHPNTIAAVPGGSCHFCKHKSTNGGRDGYCAEGK
jgi:hypothetical protein